MLMVSVFRITFETLFLGVLKCKSMTTKTYRKFRIGEKLPSILLAAMLIAIFQSSCSKFKDDLDFSRLIKPDWNPEFAIPLVNSNLTIADFFEDTSNLIIVTGDDNSLTFIYKSSNVVSAVAGDFINFRDQNFVFFNSISLPGSEPGEIDTLRYPEQFQFIPDTSDQAIDSIFFAKGKLKISGRTNLDRNTSRLELTSTSIRRIADNQPLFITANISNPFGAEWIYFDTTISLDNHKFILSQVADTLRNVMYLNQDIIITNDENPDLSPYQLVLDGALSDLEFDSFFGYLAQYDIPLDDSLKIGLFDNVVGGGISIGAGAVSLKFKLDNSFGIPVTVIADPIYAYSPIGKPNRVDIELFGPGIPNIFGINSPGFGQIGQSVENFVDFSDANFAEAFNISPQKIFYTLNAVTNYETDLSRNNFILNESTISIGVDLEFNLFASISTFVVEDTVSVDFKDNLKEIDYVTFRFNLTNAFPVDVTAQIYFANQNYVVLDSLMRTGGNILPGAPVSGPPGYGVTGPVSKITDITLDRTGMDNLTKSEYLIIRTAISTTEEKLVKFYPENYIGLKLGVISGLNVESD